MARSLSRPGDAEDLVPVLVSRGQHLNSNYFSDGEQQLVIEESFEKTHNVSTNVPQPAIKYEIRIGASRKGGDIVIDGRGYTHRFDRDFPGLRVWRCTFRGCVKFECCNSTLEQITRPGVDFLRNYSQEDFTLNSEKEHSHPPNYDVTKRQLTVSQSCSATSGRPFNLENISTAESARVSADVGVPIDYQEPHISNSQVETAKRKRCPGQRQASKKQCIAFSAEELFGDKR
jgi:hypothetical protein